VILRYYLQKDLFLNSDLVKYCSDNCQENNREQHSEECMMRLAKLHDKGLFTQPGSNYHGECPICCLPLPLDPEKSTLMSCCCKVICNGCHFTNTKRDDIEGLEHRCAFCREPLVKSQEENYKNVMERVKKNDPTAISCMGKKHYHEGDYGKALEYMTKAAELGDASAHFCLGCSYDKGTGVEKDMEKAVYHWEQAAIGGHPDARGRLAAHEVENDNFDRAARHLMINANLGHDDSLKVIKDFFKAGLVSKEDYAAALRGFQAAVNETKSAEREGAGEFNTYKSI